MTLDWSLNIGSLINAFLFIGTIVGVYMSILRRLDRLEAKMDTIWTWFIKGEQTAKQVARAIENKTET